MIDTGYARISRYSHRSKVQRLPVEAVSRPAPTSARRCGRVAAGVCIRLYCGRGFRHAHGVHRAGDSAHQSRLVILQMRILGFGEISKFPFLDPPDKRLIGTATGCWKE